jgi:hypothetical protein
LSCAVPLSLPGGVNNLSTVVCGDKLKGKQLASGRIGTGFPQDFLLDSRYLSLICIDKDEGPAVLFIAVEAAS